MPPQAVVQGGLEAYEKFGIAGLFICMYLVTIWFLVRQILASKKEMVDMVEKVVAIQEKTIKSNEDITKTMGAVKRTVEASVAQHSEFIAYLRGRDDRD